MDRLRPLLALCSISLVTHSLSVDLFASQLHGEEDAGEARGRCRWCQRGAGQPQDIAELSDVDIEHVAGQCPGCLQKFGDQDKDGWLSVSMSLEI